MMRQIVAAGLALLLLGGTMGCASAPTPLKETVAEPLEPAPPKTSDQARLKEGLTGQELPPSEVADLSDRLLANDYLLNDQETMARLELLILKAMKSPEKKSRPDLWRNLGIIHYHQKKYKQARQEFQAANELNPKNARTHFYLACLFAHEGRIYAHKGKKRISRQQFKRAAIEMEQARRLDPHNSLYKQDPKQIIQNENSE